VAAGVEKSDLIVRAVSGSEVLNQVVTFDTPVAELVKGVCSETGSKEDEVKILSGSLVLHHGLRLGDCVVPSAECPLELTLVRRLGPALTAVARSGRPIKVMKSLPPEGACCHCDRNYKFVSLGDFAKQPNMMYILTSNDDKSTPAHKVMWTLEARVPVTVYLNFRSIGHVQITGASGWLQRDGWQVSTLKSTVSTGVPNGPYRGPVYEKSFDDGGEVNLMGSNCGEGTYFVFVRDKQGLDMAPEL